MPDASFVIVGGVGYDRRVTSSVTDASELRLEERAENAFLDTL